MWAVWVTVGTAGFLAIVAVVQRKLIYHPHTTENLEASDLAHPRLEVTDAVTQTDDGLTLRGWLVSSPSTDEQSQPLVIFFSGNAGHRLYRLDECEVLVDLGCKVLVFDYRGFGDNDGSPSEKGLANDAAAVWKYARERLGRSPSEIVLYGESLGGAVTTRLVSELCQRGEAPAGVILRSTFTSMVDAGSFHFPWLPVRTLLWDRFPSDERIHSVTCPILMLHGDRDTIVPCDMGRRLFSHAPEHSDSGVHKSFVELAGADHNNVLLIAESKLSDAIRDFLSEISAMPGTQDSSEPGT